MVKNYNKLSWQQLNLLARCFCKTEEDGVDKRDISTMVDSQPKYQQVCLANCCGAFKTNFCENIQIKEIIISIRKKLTELTNEQQNT